ncbi:MAG: phosphodiester glycosidase family protein [Anaerolineales bacterium]
MIDQLKTHKLFIVTLLAAIIGLALVGSANAQEETPTWLDNLDCSLEDRSDPGVVYCESVITYSDGGATPVYVVGIDLQNPGVRVEYIIASGKDRNGNIGECKDTRRTVEGKVGCDDPNNSNYYPLIPWQDAIHKYENTVVVVTSDYGAHSCSRDHGPEGLTIVRGERLDGHAMNDHDNTVATRPWMALSNPPSENAKIDQMDEDIGIPEDWMYTGVGGAPWLIHNGVVKTDKIKSCDQAPGSCYAEASQVAIGLSKDNRWLFVVVGEHPRTLLDMANFMHQKLDAYQAFKLDGGGSTKLWYGGADRYIEGNRQLSQYLAVIAQPADSLPPNTVDGFGIGSPHLRVNIETIAPWLDKQQQMGLQFSRGDIPWELVEPDLGNWQWRGASPSFNFDQLLTQYRRRDIQMLAILDYGPRFLKGDPANNDLVDSQKLLEYWRGYVRQVVQEFGDRIDYWEVGNEMNSRKFWGKVVVEQDRPCPPKVDGQPPRDELCPDGLAEPDPALYAQMLIIAYEEIKAHDPDDVVILGGLVTLTDADCATNPFDYLYRLNAANPAVWGAMDAVALHPYWGAHPPEAVINRGKAHNPNTGACLPSQEAKRSLIEEVRAFRDLTAVYGEKPVWITEIGWSEAELNNPYRPNSQPDEIEADYLIRTYVPLLSEPGVEAVIWYTQVDDPNDPSGKFALGELGQRALSNLSALLQGSQPLGQFQGQDDEWNAGDDVFEYRFEKDGQLIIVVWKAQGALDERDVRLENLDVTSFRRYPLDTASLSPASGQELTVADDGTLTLLSLNERPVFLVSEKLNWWDTFWQGIQNSIQTWWQEQQDNFTDWTQEQRDKIAAWWQDQMENIQRQVHTWWEDVQRKAMEEAEKQVEDLVTRICGGALVPAGAAVALWGRRRRRRRAPSGRHSEPKKEVQN